MPYLLDANVFIQAKNLHYGLDFCPAFWDWLIAENADKNVFSIERVADEILAGGDELADWADERGADFFLKPDASMLPALGTVSAWVAAQSYEPAAVNTFLLVADYCSRARARVHRRYAREGLNLDQEDQDSRALHWTRRKVRYSLRDVTHRTREIRTRCEGILVGSWLAILDDMNTSRKYRLLIQQFMVGERLRIARSQA